MFAKVPGERTLQPLTAAVLQADRGRRPGLSGGLQALQGCSTCLLQLATALKCMLPSQRGNCMSAQGPFMHEGVACTWIWEPSRSESQGAPAPRRQRSRAQTAQHCTALTGQRSHHAPCRHSGTRFSSGRAVECGACRRCATAAGTRLGAVPLSTDTGICKPSWKYMQGRCDKGCCLFRASILRSRSSSRSFCAAVRRCSSVSSWAARCSASAVSRRTSSILLRRTSSEPYSNNECWFAYPPESRRIAMLVI